MPYIDVASRLLLEPGIANVAAHISKMHTTRPGDMNYAVSSLIRRVYGEHLKYHEINEILGVLGCITQEFYRRRAAPYEDKKIIENSDIYIDKP